MFVTSSAPLGTSSVGVIGLGVMGSSLCLNLAERSGGRVSGFDISEVKVTRNIKSPPGHPGACSRRARAPPPPQAMEASKRARKEGNLPFDAYTDMKSFVRSLARPRRVILLVPAGPAVDAALDSLTRVLSGGDVIVDMGNEWYKITEDRMARMQAKGLLYMGCAPGHGRQSRNPLA